ncbi:MAG: hypothetical protein K2N52_03210 [Clostridia bacterium]|nr:hypothetical protein [Clostridia bacterium]
MKQLTPNQQIIADDILRYKKNKLAQILAILGIVFNCLYFCLLYAIPDANMWKVGLGVSIVLTLVLLLVVFLSSEGVKGYNYKFSIVLLVVAMFQIARIFYYPLKGLQANTLQGIGYFGYYPNSSGVFFALLIVWLCASAACLIASAVIGWIYSARLAKFQKALDKEEISVEQTLKEMDAEDEANALKVDSSVELDFEEGK